MNYIEVAKKLHKESVVVDAHMDLATEIYERNLRGEFDIIKKYHLDNFTLAGINIIVSSIFIPTERKDTSLKEALLQIDALKKDILSIKDRVTLVTSNIQLDDALKDNKIAIILSLEGLLPMDSNVELLDTFYELGVRGAGITWSRENSFAFGSTFNIDSPTKNLPLKKDGKRIVKRMEELGIFVDLTHLNDGGALDIIDNFSLPIIASHSNPRSIIPMERSIPDIQIRAIASRDGVIGLNAIKPLAGVEDTDDSIEVLVKHLLYTIDLVGSQHVGFGFDLCNGLSDVDGGPKLDSISGHQDSILITAKLLENNVPIEDIKNIIGRNFYNFFKRVLLE